MRAKDSKLTTLDLRRGESCVHNFLGGIDFPLVGETAIPIKGSDTLMDALKSASITEVSVIEHTKKNYLFYTKLLPENYDAALL